MRTSRGYQEENAALWLWLFPGKAGRLPFHGGAVAPQSRMSGVELFDSHKRAEKSPKPGNPSSFVEHR